MKVHPLERALLSLLALSALSFAFATNVAARPAADEVDDLMKEVERSRDEVDPDVLVRISGFRSRAAADALIRAYDIMGSVFMKREVVRALAKLDGTSEAEQTALQMVMDVATDSEDSELREAALESLGDSRHLGKSFLEMIVESPAEDDVREQALRLHVTRAEESDREWYKKLYVIEKQRKPDKDKKRKKKDEEEEEKELKVHRLASVREVAFDALSAELETDELKEACEDSWPAIRRLALEQLFAKDPNLAESWARETFDDIEERAANRAAAARILAAIEGKRVAGEFIDTADAFITPLSLRMALAEILADFDDPKVNSTLTKRVGKGKKAYEKLWVLHAVRGMENPKLYKSILRLLSDKDPQVAIAAAQVLGERRETEALKALEKVVDKSKEPELVIAAVDAISNIRAGDPEWMAQLVTYTTDENRDIRNAAIRRLGKTGDPQYIDVIVKGFESQQWSTRLATLNALAAMRTPAAVGPIVAQMPNESGRMLHEFADVLFRLSGMPYRTAAKNWGAWWEKSKGDFQVLSQTELAKREEEEEERRLRQVTNVKFFGIRIVSERVIFIIDVSGSMAEMMRSKYEGETSSKARIDVAKEQLAASVKGLDRNALFNILIFSNGVDSWLDSGITGSTGKSREDADEWIGRLGAGGGTNLYDAVQQAFEDPDVDTIFILSDGEPTVGSQTDPGTIRDHVRRWNENRGVIIHSISIGLQLEVLEWLAGDNGGKYVQFF